MALEFVVTSREGSWAGVYESVVVDGNVVTAGRDEETGLMLPDPSVSRRHFSVRGEGEGWIVEDLGSRLGTLVNARRLERGSAVPLREGDEIEAGIFCVVFRGWRDEQICMDTNMAARSLIRCLGRRTGEGLPALRVENGPGKGTCYEVPEGVRLRIGRGRNVEVVVDDAMVSRVHAVVHNRAGALWFADADSANGSFIDDVRIQEPTRIRNGSRLGLGRIRLTVLDPGQQRPSWLWPGCEGRGILKD